MPHAELGFLFSTHHHVEDDAHLPLTCSQEAAFRRRTPAAANMLALPGDL